MATWWSTVRGNDRRIRRLAAGRTAATLRPRGNVTTRRAVLLNEMCLGPRQFVTGEEGVDNFVVEGDEAGDRGHLGHRVVVGPSDVRMNCVADSRAPVPRRDPLIGAD